MAANCHTCEPFQTQQRDVVTTELDSSTSSETTSPNRRSHLHSLRSDPGGRGEHQDLRRLPAVRGGCIRQQMRHPVSAALAGQSICGPAVDAHLPAAPAGEGRAPCTCQQMRLIESRPKRSVIPEHFFVPWQRCISTSCIVASAAAGPTDACLQEGASACKTCQGLSGDTHAGHLQAATTSMLTGSSTLTPLMSHALPADLAKGVKHSVIWQLPYAIGNSRR